MLPRCRRMRQHPPGQRFHFLPVYETSLLPCLQGAGTLASIRFHASTTGSSPLGMSEVKMIDTRGAACQPAIQSGYVRVLDKGVIYLPVVR